MIYQVYEPAPQLKKYVRDYLLMHFRFDTKKDIPIKPYPACPKQGIIFSIRGTVISNNVKEEKFEKRAKAVVFGQPVSRQNLYFTSEILVLSVRFHHGTLYKFLGIPMTEFVQKNIDAELVLGKEIRQVSEQLANSEHYTEIIKVIETFLCKKLHSLKDSEQPINGATQLIINDPSVFSLDKLARYACLSASQFERKFVQQVGITPKLFARICRFYKAFLMKQKYPGKNWLEVAWDTGYTDYQHLVRDFKDFSGGTPRTLENEEQQSPEHYLGLNPGYTHY